MRFVTARDSSSSYYLFAFKEVDQDPNSWAVEVSHIITTYGSVDDTGANIDGASEIIQVMTSDAYVTDTAGTDAIEFLYTKNFLEQWLTAPQAQLVNTLQGADTPDAFVEFFIPKNITVQMSPYIESPTTPKLKDDLDIGAEMIGYELKQIDTLGINVPLSDVNKNSHVYYHQGETDEVVESPYADEFMPDEITVKRAAIIGANIPRIFVGPNQTLDPSIDNFDPEEDVLEGGLTDEQRKNSLPLNEQAILLYRLGELMPRNRKKRNSKDYDRFACLECKTADEIANLVNSVTSPPNRAPLFDLVRPIHLSAVIPRVRLFKMYDPSAKRMKNTKKPANTPKIPVEYEFEEFSNRDLLKETLSTNTGVGIESFNFDFNGTNKFSAERLISAELKIRARSIDELERLRVSSATKRPYRFSDLFIPEMIQQDNANKRPNNLNYIEYKAKHFESRMVVEYGIDTESAVFTSREGKQIADAFYESKLEINLSVTSHSIDLKDDGSMVVTINFVGRLDALAKDPNSGNILMDTNLSDKMRLELLTERNAAQEAVDLARETKDEAEIDNVTEDDRVRDGQTRQTKEETNAIADETIATNTETYNLGQKDGERKFLEKNGDNLSKLRLYRSILNGLIRKEAVNIVEIDPSNIALTTQSTEEQALSASEDGGKAGKEIANIETLNTKEQIDEQFKILSDRMKKGIVPMFTSNAYYIRFFYFGDLMDVVLDHMYEGREDAALDIRTVLGPIEIRRNLFDSYQFSGEGVSFQHNGAIVVTDKYGTFDPKATRRRKAAVEQVEEGLNNGKKAPSAGIEEQTLLASLADVPISLNLFLRWFADNISNKGAFGYSFKQFLVDATQGLIVASLEADSSRILLPKQQRIVRTVTWDSATDLSTPDVFGFTHKDGQELKIELPTQQRNLVAKEGLQISRLRDEFNIAHTLSTAPYMSDYLMVYAEAPRYNRAFEGTPTQYKRDLKDGIYHLSVGRDVGMVKDVKLSAVTVPYYEEMQIQRAAKNGVRPTKRIYEATVTLFGVTFFRPGQTVYLNAAAFGSRENLKAHGLCGYYSIRTVSTNFSSGNFETTLICDFKHAG
tara:strand:- start:7577 stop:10822 length:3246 start_codon:yes stop_codon:yes gene_type:complete